MNAKTTTPRPAPPGGEARPRPPGPGAGRFSCRRGGGGARRTESMSGRHRSRDPRLGRAPISSSPLIRHHEEKAKAEHPLARIIEIEPADDGILVTTTDIHLARDLGEALHHSCQGDLEFHYNEDQKLLRVHWHR